MTEPLAFGVEPSDRRYRLRLARYPALAAAIAAFAASRGDGETRLLDAGVGRGRTRRYVLAAAPKVAGSVSFHGLDLAADLAARCHDAAAWRLVRGDAQCLPYRDASFDVVVCEQVLEHVDDPGGALREIARCLRPGGLLVAGVPTFPPGVAWLRDRLARGRRAGVGHAHGHVRTFTARSFARLVRAQGFDVRTLRGFRSFSGGIASPLEDFRWWWRANAAFGRAFPSLCAEAQVVAARR